MLQYRRMIEKGFNGMIRKSEVLAVACAVVASCLSGAWNDGIVYLTSPATLSSAGEIAVDAAKSPDLPGRHLLADADAIENVAALENWAKGGTAFGNYNVKFALDGGRFYADVALSGFTVIIR